MTEVTVESVRKELVSVFQHMNELPHTDIWDTPEAHPLSMAQRAIRDAMTCINLYEEHVNNLRPRLEVQNNREKVLRWIIEAYPDAAEEAARVHPEVREYFDQLRMGYAPEEATEANIEYEPVPEEGDIFFGMVNGKLRIWENGTTRAFFRGLGVGPNEDYEEIAIDHIRGIMRRNNFFPNVWRIEGNGQDPILVTTDDPEGAWNA